MNKSISIKRIYVRFQPNFLVMLNNKETGVSITPEAIEDLIYVSMKSAIHDINPHDELCEIITMELISLERIPEVNKKEYKDKLIEIMGEINDSTYAF